MDTHTVAVADLAPETQVCRCEEILAGEIQQAISDGAATINDVKRRTRAGMGVCQGIFCTRTIAAMIHHGAGVSFDDLVPMTARPPARLIPLAQLAASEE
jgi:NAD(P)H-nitrite reductase large subunit